MEDQVVIVVETCQNCKKHEWHTRHDESKYQDNFKRIASAVIELMPNAIVMKNQIPKQYLHYDLYNNLVPNDDPNLPYYQQVPRTGAFEISYKGQLLYSKLKGGNWPEADEFARVALQIVQEDL